MAQAVGVQVLPLVIDKTVGPRDIFTEIITLTNDQSYLLTVYPTINEVEADSSGGIKDLVSPVQDDRARSITSWVTLRQAGVDIKPGETIEIPISVSVNPKAAIGEYHAFIGFAGGRNRPEAETKVKNGIAPGVLLRLEIPDKTVERVAVDGFIVDRFVFSSADNTVTYTIKNPGDKSVVPSGEIIFYNTRGSEVGSTIVNPEKLVLEPKSALSFITTAPTSGVMGKYKAYLSVDYGSSQLASVYDTAFFYYVPWKQLWALLGGLALFSLILFLYLYRRLRAPAAFFDHAVLPFHIYSGKSDDIEHDINLKQK